MLLARPMSEHDDENGSDPEGPDAQQKRPGERLAKAIARAGLGSRRDAELWIGQGRVKINGATVDSAAVNVLPHDKVEVDGRPLPARERTRLWLYHKPRGYVTTNHDPEGRETVFSILPSSLPRVMTVGRLDINTEGLLLLTNDGGLARVLELPETGWLRRYRVRAFGRTTPEALAALKDGVEIDGFAYGAIEAEIERQQADNVWLRFGLREGKNREVKRVAEHLGLSVNRLIRISFGPFQLGSLPEGEVEEVRTRTLIDQLGKRLTEEAGCDFKAAATSFGEDAPRMTGGRGAGRSRATSERSKLADPTQRVGRRAPVVRPRDAPAPAAAPESGEKETTTRRAASIADRKGRTVKVERVAHDSAEAPVKRVRKRDDGAAERFGAQGRPARPPREGAKPDARGPRPPRRDDATGGDRPSFGDRRPRGDRPDSGGPDRGKPFERRSERSASGDRPRPSSPRRRDDASATERSPRPAGDRPERSRSDRPTDGRPPRGKPFDRRSDGAPSGDRSRSSSDRGPRPTGDRPDRPRSDRPADGRPPRGKPFERRPEGATSEDRPRSAPRSASPRWRDEASSGAADRAPRPSHGRSDRPSSPRPPRGDRPAGEGGSEGRPPRGKPYAGKPSGAPRGDRPAPSGDRPGGARPSGGKPGGYKPGGSKPGGFSPRGPGGGKPGGGGRPGGKPGGGKPGGGRPSGGKPGRGPVKGPGGGADRRR